jgi:hypothetical protein
VVINLREREREEINKIKKMMLGVKIGFAAD